MRQPVTVIGAVVVALLLASGPAPGQTPGQTPDASGPAPGQTPDASGPAPGQTPDIAAAKKHFKAGQALVQMEKWGAAIEEFVKAYEITRDGLVMGQIGQAYESAGESAAKSIPTPFVMPTSR